MEPGLNEHPDDPNSEVPPSAESIAFPVATRASVGRRPTPTEFGLFLAGLSVIVIPLCWMAAQIGSENHAALDRFTAWDVVPWLFPAGALILGRLVWRGWVRTLRPAPVDAAQPIGDAPATRTPLSSEDLAGIDVGCPFCHSKLRDGTGDTCPGCGNALFAEDVFPALRDVAALPVLDPKLWAVPRERTPR